MDGETIRDRERSPAHGLLTIEFRMLSLGVRGPGEGCYEKVVVRELIRLSGAAIAQRESLGRLRARARPSLSEERLGLDLAREVTRVLRVKGSVWRDVRACSVPHCEVLEAERELGIPVLRGCEDQSARRLERGPACLATGDKDRASMR